MTKFVIKGKTANLYYAGNTFVSDPEKALKFETRQEAAKRCRIRSDWIVEPIEVEAEVGYAYHFRRGFENLSRGTLGISLWSHSKT